MNKRFTLLKKLFFLVLTINKNPRLPPLGYEKIVSAAYSVLMVTSLPFGVRSSPAGESAACQHAIVLSDANRHFSLGNINDRCDDNLQTTWYRFELNGQPAEIPTTCIMNNHCGTQVPLHLDTGGQDLPGVNETAKFYVCASYNVLGKWDCCVLRKPVYVKNCGGYNVYYLQPPDRCPVGYCVQESNQLPFSNITAKTGEYVHTSDNPGHSEMNDTTVASTKVSDNPGHLEMNDMTVASTTVSDTSTTPRGANSDITPHFSSSGTATESSIFNTTTNLSNTSISQTRSLISSVTQDSISVRNTTSTLNIAYNMQTHTGDDSSNKTTTPVLPTRSSSTLSILSVPLTTHLSNVFTDELIGFNQTCGDNSTLFFCGNNTCFKLADHVEMLCPINSTHMACVEACNAYPECVNNEDELIALCSNGGCSEGQQYCPNRQGCFSNCNEPRVQRILTLNISAENNSKSTEKIQSPMVDIDLKLAIMEAFNQSSVYLNQIDVTIVNASVTGAENSTLELTVLLNVSETVAVDDLIAMLHNDSFLDLVAKLLFEDEGDTNSTEILPPTIQTTIRIQGNYTTQNHSSVMVSTAFSRSSDSVISSNELSSNPTVHSETFSQEPTSSQPMTISAVTSSATDTSELLSTQIKTGVQTPSPVANITEETSTLQPKSNQTMIPASLNETTETQTFLSTSNSQNVSQTSVLSVPTSSSNTTITNLVLTTLFLEQSTTSKKQTDASSTTIPNETTSQTSTNVLGTSISSTVEIPLTGVSQASESFSTTSIPVNTTFLLDTEGMQQTTIQSNNLTTYSASSTTVGSVAGSSHISSRETNLQTTTQQSTGSDRNATDAQKTISMPTVTPASRSDTSPFLASDSSSVVSSSSVQTSLLDNTIQTTLPVTTENSQISTSERILATIDTQTSASVLTTTLKKHNVSSLLTTLQSDSTLSAGTTITSSHLTSFTTDQTENTTQPTHTSTHTEMTTSDMEQTTSIRTTDMEQSTRRLNTSTFSIPELETTPTYAETTQIPSQLTSSRSSIPTTGSTPPVASSESVEQSQTTTQSESLELTSSLTTTIVNIQTTTQKQQQTSQADKLKKDSTVLSKEITTIFSDITTDISSNITDVQVTDVPAVDNDHEIIVFFKENKGLFIFLVVASVAMLGICLFGIGGTIYQRRMRTWSPEDTLDDIYPDMEKSMISIGREGAGVESPIPDIDILQSEETGEGESISKASTLVCRSPADRLQGTGTGSPDTPVAGTCRETQIGFQSLNGHANEAYQSDESIDLDGVTPFDELDEKPPRNMFPWIDTAEDTKV